MSGEFLRRLARSGAHHPELGTQRLLIPPLLVGGAAISWGVLGRLRQQYGLDRAVVTAHRLLVGLTGLAFLWVL